jgi:CDP-diacylglycerol--glycerol-3-phosphate 3-phosphatidyltransferase
MRTKMAFEGAVEKRQSYRLPNAIIGGRVVLAFTACALLSLGSAPAAAIAVMLTVVVLAMDGLDGMVARRLGLASKLGGVLDITADRIVEHVYWITFAVAHVVPLWVPLVVVTRSVVVDAVRGLALTQGRTAFGESTMARSALSRFLTGSRVMRSAYGFAKVGAFVLLGAVVAVGVGEERTGASALEVAAAFSVALAVGLCLVRGVPVLLEAPVYAMLNAMSGSPAARP